MSVRYELKGGVATLHLDDGKVNVLSLATQAELHAALDRAEQDRAVVLLAGRPGVFSAGFDLTVLRGGGPDAGAMLRGGFELAARILALPTPVVMACTGHAIAMGCFLMLSGDYRVGAAGPYKLMANEVAIGLAVPVPGLEILRSRLTPSAFNRATLLAEQFSPETAVGAGFLDRVVPPDELLATATGVARNLAMLDRAAYAETKRRIRQSTLEAIAAAGADVFAQG